MTDHFSEASHWLALRSHGGDVSAEDERRFARWMEDADNRRAYAEVERLYAEAAQVRLFSESEIASVVKTTRAPARRRPGVRTRWAAWRTALFSGVGAALAAVAIAVTVLRDGAMSPAEVERVVHATAVGETRLATLSDGSEVVLDSGTRFETAFLESERRVNGFEGRAVFTVEGDFERPFVIDAGAARVRVVGTRFQVDRQAGRVNVAVLHGVVDVSADGGPGREAQRVTLTAGQQVSVEADGGLSAVSMYSAADFATWRGGRIDFRQRPLRDVVREAERYFDGDIVLSESGLGGMEISGSFRTSDPVGFLTALEMIAPVRVKRVNARRIEIEAKN